MHAIGSGIPRVDFFLIALVHGFGLGVELKLVAFLPTHTPYDDIRGMCGVV